MFANSAARWCDCDVLGLSKKVFFYDNVKKEKNTITTKSSYGCRYVYIISFSNFNWDWGSGSTSLNCLLLVVDQLCLWTLEGGAGARCATEGTLCRSTFNKVPPPIPLSSYVVECVASRLIVFVNVMNMYIVAECAKFSI